MQPANTNNLLRGLKENWFLIVFLGSLIIGWTNFRSDIKALGKEQDDQGSQIVTLQKGNTELTSAVIQMQAQYIFIKESLADLKKQKE